MRREEAVIPDRNQPVLQAIQNYVNNILRRSFLMLIQISIPVFILSFAFITTLFVSTCTCFLIRSNLISKALVMEPLHFDYTHEPMPEAVINLRIPSQQWNVYRRSHDEPKISEYLHSGAGYDIDITFSVPYSDSNLNWHYNSMVRTTIYDSTGAAISRSSRQIIIPYRSLISRFLDGILLYPFRLIGFKYAFEYTTVRVQAFKNFQYKDRRLSSADIITIDLNSKDIHIGESFLTISPVREGLSYFLYHYPVLSSTLLIGFVECLQVGVIILTAIMYLVYTQMDALEDHTNVNEWNRTTQTQYQPNEQTDRVYNHSKFISSSNTLFRRSRQQNENLQ